MFSNNINTAQVFALVSTEQFYSSDLHWKAYKSFPETGSWERAVTQNILGVHH